MPRRVAGQIWAIRITMTLTDTEEALFKIPNTVCVYHAGGSRSAKGFVEKPHYHIYYNAGKEVKKEEVQQLVKSNEIVSKYYKSSNAFWSVDTDVSYTLQSYWKYVWASYPIKKQRLIHWGIPEEQLSIPEPISELSTDSLLVSTTASSVINMPQKPKTTTTHEKQLKFLKYCKEYYELGGTPTNNGVLKLLYEYCSKNGATTQNCAYTYVNFVMSNLLQGEAREVHKQQFADRLERIFFI